MPLIEADNATYGVVTLHGYAKTPPMIAGDIGPVKPGLEMYVETLGMFIVFPTVHAQANQTIKRPLNDHESLLESRFAIKLFPMGTNEPLYPFRPSMLKVFRESKDALGAFISTQFIFPS